jgi:hypothetical protein
MMRKDWEGVMAKKNGVELVGELAKVGEEAGRTRPEGPGKEALVEAEAGWIHALPSRIQALATAARESSGPRPGQADAPDAVDALEAVYERVEGLEALAFAVAEQLQHLQFVTRDPEVLAARRRLGQLVHLLADSCEAARVHAAEAIERLVVPAEPAAKARR